MKVLQINCIYRTGSTGKIVFDIHMGLKDRGIESIVCFGRGERKADLDVFRFGSELEGKLDAIRSRMTGLMYGGCFFSTRKLIKIIKREKPDIVHLHCINGHVVNIYQLIKWLKESQIKTVLTLHAEFMYTGSCGHALDCEKWKTGCGNCPRVRQETNSWIVDNTAKSWKKMKIAFEGFESNCIITSVSSWLMERAKESPILKSFRHRTVLNGINTKLFCPIESEELQTKFDLNGEKIVFHATANFSERKDDLKGGWVVIELARRLKDDRVKFLVASNHTEVANVPENMILLGRIVDQRELAMYYSMADVTLLTSKKETFSMVAAESLCCGTPVVGFEAGGPEKIALPKYSSFAHQGDIDEIEALLRQTIVQSFESCSIARMGEKKYSVQRMCEDYKIIYEELLNNNKERLGEN